MDILSASYSFLSYNYQKYVLKKKWHIWSSPEVTQTFSLPENIVYQLRRNATNHMDLNSWNPVVSSNPKTIVNVDNRNKEITEEQLLSWPVRYSFTGEFTANISLGLLLTSNLLSKALISNVWRIVLKDQDLTFKEYKFLTANTSQIILEFCEIVGEDKQRVPALRLIPWDSKFEHFDFFCDYAEYFPHETLKEMAAKTISNLSVRKVELVLRPLPLDFDITLLLEFLMNNQSKNLTVELGFGLNNELISRNTQEFIDQKLKDLPKEKKPNVKIISW